MPQTITVPNWQKGGTLSQIASQYGTTVAELQKANNIANPDQIREGQTLIIPDKTSSSASLSGTLPSEKTLPETPSDNLSVFRGLLRTVSERAGQEATATGVAGIGFEPSTVSGGTLAGVVNFIKGQKTQGIADIFKSTTDLLDTQQKQAQDQLELLISSGGIADLTDNALSKLSITSGMDLDLLMGIRSQKQAEKKQPSSFATVKKGGKEVRIGFDKMGNIISEVPIGEATGSEGNKFTDLTTEQKGKVVEWMSQQPEFDPSDLKKMDEDETFYNYIISEYYKANAVQR